MSEMVKARNYDEDGFVKRAACICVNEDESQVLLVSSRRDSRLWIVPGGGVEPNEMPDMAAIREVREEAGVCGMLGRCLGVFENSARRHRTNVYVLVVTEEMEEWDEAKDFGRKRKWFDLEEAVEQLAKHKPVQSSYVSLLLPDTDPHTANKQSPSTCRTGKTVLPPAVPPPPPPPPPLPLPSQPLSDLIEEQVSPVTASPDGGGGGGRGGGDNGGCNGQESMESNGDLNKV